MLDNIIIIEYYTNMKFRSGIPLKAVYSLVPNLTNFVANFPNIPQNRGASRFEEINEVVDLCGK